jgi:hypothetical protein
MTYWLFWDVTRRRLVVTTVLGQPIRLVFKGQQSKKNGLSSCSYTRQQDPSLPNCIGTMKNVLFSVSRCWQMRWDGIFGVVTRLWDDSRVIMVQFTGEARVQIAFKCGFAAPTASYSTGTGDSFLGCKAAGAWGWSFTSDAKITNEWSSTSAPLCVFMVCTGMTVPIPLPYFTR